MPADQHTALDHAREKELASPLWHSHTTLPATLCTCLIARRDDFERSYYLLPGMWIYADVFRDEDTDEPLDVDEYWWAAETDILRELGVA